MNVNLELSKARKGDADAMMRLACFEYDRGNYANAIQLIKVASDNEHELASELYCAIGINEALEAEMQSPNFVPIPISKVENKILYRQPFQVPSLTTVNSVGFRLFFSWDTDYRTESVVKTHYFVILFMPFIPTARYRVMTDDNRSYRFLTKEKLQAVDFVPTLIWFLVFLMMGLIK